MVGYHAADRSRSSYDNDPAALNLSEQLGRIMGDQEIEAYKDILKFDFHAREKILESHLERALVAQVASNTDAAANDLASERAAMQMRFGQVTHVARRRLEAGLAAGEMALQRAEPNRCRTPRRVAANCCRAEARVPRA